MGWASNYISQLQSGQMVNFKPRGNSMSGLINTGDLVFIEPLSNSTLPLLVGDIVLCKVKGREYLHKITAKKGDQYQISNNHNHINGWIKISSIYGVCEDIIGKKYGAKKKRKYFSNRWI